MKIAIGVAAHKKYWMPKSKMYIPIQVGALGKEAIYEFKDDVGDNISNKNKNYCELTALYWMWKHLSDSYDYLGLVHYRRYFRGIYLPIGKYSILSFNKLKRILKNVDVVLPEKYIYKDNQTMYEQYATYHHEIDLIKTKEVINDLYPEYIDSFNKEFNKKENWAFNMFIMRKDYFVEYCKWLFDILFELEKRLDISNYDEYNQRVFGFVSERLLSVWINKNNLKYKELKVVHLENY